MSPPETPRQPGRALVTGASRGIGAAIAKELARRGRPVIVNYRRDEQGAAAVVDEIRGAGGEAEAHPFDVADAAQTGRAIEALLESGPIDVVVNNAGMAADAAFPAMSLDAWQSVTRTTLDGFFNVTQPLVMPMVRARFGRIVAIGSVSGVLGNRGQANYAAAKAGLGGAVKTLARELAKRHITVNVVAPGLVDTEMLAGVALDEAIKQIPMRRLGRPEEVAKLVGFLVSDDAAYITGQIIGIDGGMT